MAITPMSDDLNIISALDDEPNDAGGLTAAQAKAKFDEAGNMLQSYLNDTMIPELDAVHLPYDYTVSGGQTIKDALDGVVLGTIPDSTITKEKFHSSAYNTESEAKGGEALIGIMPPIRVKQAIQYSNFPFETLTATWSESVGASTTVTKTISHTLGKAPSKLLINFIYAAYSATVEVLFNGTAYNYRMIGHQSDLSGYGFGVWKKSDITSGYLFGVSPTSQYWGSGAIGSQADLRLGDIVVTTDTISLPITNANSSSSSSISSSVNVEVYP